MEETGFIYDFLGQKGVVATIGLTVFIVVFRYSKDVFAWVEDKVYKNREYIRGRFEILNRPFNEEKITYVLLGASFGSGFFILLLFSYFGSSGVGLFLGLIAFFAGWYIPKPIVNRMVKQKTTDYQNQMVDGLQLLANGLRAGQSFPQGLAMVVDELPNPISEEFNYILKQNKIGVPMEECLEELYNRLPIADNQMFVSSINILHETGGNLPETFSTIVEIIRERIRLQQKIDTFVANGMTQGTVIALMPFAIGYMQYVSNPESVIKLFTTPIGLVILVGALLLDIVGYLVMLKIVDIKA